MNKLSRHIIVVAAAVGLLWAGAGAPAAADGLDPDLDLGPRVIETGTGPTGQAVTFRYRAPDDVERVRIWGEWQFSSPSSIVSTTSADGRFGDKWQPGDVVAPAAPGFLLSEMTRGDDGVWSWTTPLPAGTFSYHFVHDDCPGPSNTGCVRHIDPANPGWASRLTPTGAQTFSQVHVPAHPDFPTNDYPAQVPTSPERTGVHEHRRYVSPASTSPVGTHHLVVYLPSGYDPERAVPYPTLYLSHGQGGNEAHWSNQGLSNIIMENLVAEGVVQPMVIVATNFNGLAGDPGYAQDVKENVLPFVEREYNVSRDPADRAFGGQSLGGARGLHLLYEHTDTFEYYGSWAAAAFPGRPDAAQVANVRGVRGGIHLGTGRQDFPGNIAANSFARAQVLRDAGVRVVEHNVDGTHTWDAARQLYEDYLRTVVFRTTETSLALVAGDGGIRARVSVSPLGSAATPPTGAVELRRGLELVATAQLDGDGEARMLLDDDQLSGGGLRAVYLGDRLFNGSESAAAASPVVEVTPRVLGGRVYLSVAVTNAASVPVDVVVTTAYGSKRFSQVAPGATVSASANSRLSAVPAGELKVEVAGDGVAELKTMTYGPNGS